MGGRQCHAHAPNVIDDALATHFDSAAAETREEAWEQCCDLRLHGLVVLLAQRADQQEIQEARHDNQDCRTRTKHCSRRAWLSR